MNKQTKALVFQLLCFAVLFIGLRFLIAEFGGLSGYWIPITAAVIATLLCPIFKAVRTRDGEKLFVKWIFLPGIKEIK
ncbi:MAG: hypothetical protein IR153_00855 [Flavobacterium sp.]|nr:hypothetical protein [Flavobacterium sp.]